MAWCRQPTSHYLSQCWSESLSPYGATRPQWVLWQLGKWETCCRYFEKNQHLIQWWAVQLLWAWHLMVPRQQQSQWWQSLGPTYVWNQHLSIKWSWDLLHRNTWYSAENLTHVAAYSRVLDALISLQLFFHLGYLGNTLIKDTVNLFTCPWRRKHYG